MAAKLNLLPRKEFEIILLNEDGSVKETIKGKFGTWALNRFCTKKKIAFNQLSKMSADEFGLEHVIEMILCAVENVARKAKIPFNYSDVDVCDWIDEFPGGVASLELAQLFNHSNAESELPPPPDSEKKTEESSPGVTSSATTAVLVAP